MLQLAVCIERGWHAACPAVHYDSSDDASRDIPVLSKLLGHDPARFLPHPATTVALMPQLPA